MCKSFALLAFLGVFLNTLCSKTAAKNRLPQFTKTGDKNFNLSCLMFGDVGCDLECKITSKLYGYSSRGECGKTNNLINICQCINQEASVNYFKIWKKKFVPDDIHLRILKNFRSIQEVTNILDNPKRTGEEIKSLLKPILSPYQYSKLIVNDDSPAAKYIKNDEVDIESVQKFVSDELDEFLKHPWSKAQSLLDMNYKSSFETALNSVRDRGTLYNFVYKAIGLGNEGLEKIVDTFLGIYEFEKPTLDWEEEPLVMNTLHYIIVNEFIKRNEAKKKQKEAEKSNFKIEGIPDDSEKN